MLELKNISKSYGDQLILNDVSFEVKEKELVSILGPSGSGKSTLLQIIGLLNPADSGSILLDNIECTTLNDKLKFEAFMDDYKPFYNEQSLIF